MLKTAGDHMHQVSLTGGRHGKTTPAGEGMAEKKYISITHSGLQQFLQRAAWTDKDISSSVTEKPKEQTMTAEHP